LICISFMSRNGEHFFLCFFAIWSSSFQKFCFVQLPTSLLVHSLILGEFTFLNYRYILVISSLSDV
jgi:hypothetical protein